jgi:hypothetical protein
MYTLSHGALVFGLVSPYKKQYNPNSASSTASVGSEVVES